ncbi:regulatory protein GemA [Metasolibacillus meyeri]|uniref:Regulatory protein GemA n=1 Tax=Metasolibacillus meyeri TaxID=1071052 RepID=A0AAW9NUK1_9BACL|nr:regulatory protein GemA [Metasolibacillus meyeri]MEC1178518.1 regulatory protein GemA [Metasolibacillus meyeri]
MTVVKKIWAIARDIGMEREDIYSVLLRETGKDSMRKCSQKELERVLLSLRAVQGHRDARSNKATKKQLWKIEQLEQQLNWQSEPQRLQGFLKKYYKVERVEWLTSKQAWRLIESLKKLLEKENSNG